MISVALQGVSVHLHYSIVYLDLIAEIGRAALADALNEDPGEFLCERPKFFISKPSSTDRFARLYRPRLLRADSPDIRISALTGTVLSRIDVERVSLSRR